ncbi:hypothetical protein T265_02035 [Opisthorchis viverrini]|uniref:Uncharacterized protein n=1 Tax=Opisthorchis viverrini TaxID=6198 RepID=A0A075AIK7_OPIVI|nr:hypothetical protein T265_02035 [Opisthorchis viverrini]KER31804.1 hypothetical protein T265_02035 [Opisthorchis viverrini]
MSLPSNSTEVKPTPAARILNLKARLRTTGDGDAHGLLEGWCNVTERPSLQGVPIRHTCMLPDLQVGKPFKQSFFLLMPLYLVPPDTHHTILLSFYLFIVAPLPKLQTSTAVAQTPRRTVIHSN